MCQKRRHIDRYTAARTNTPLWHEIRGLTAAIKFDNSQPKTFRLTFETVAGMHPRLSLLARPELPIRFTLRAEIRTAGIPICLRFGARNSGSRPSKFKARRLVTAYRDCQLRTLPNHPKPPERAVARSFASSNGRSSFRRRSRAALQTPDPDAALVRKHCPADYRSRRCFRWSR